ncbi:MAG: hypothetical protein ABI867_43725 [Kofleriaceae bacterium]
MTTPSFVRAHLVFSVLATSCAAPAVPIREVPAHPAATRSPAATHADDLFWQTLHTGSYDRIPDALRALKAAYLAEPRDAITAARIGWLHIWRLAERARMDRPDPAITDDAVLGRRYFEQAVRLAPGEARYLGFYASLLLTEASIHDDDELRQRGAATMAQAVAAWPEFNLFTAGYGASTRPYDSERFRQALANQWLNLEACVGHPIDHAHPEIPRERPSAMTTKTKRACVNTEIAPHNSEGFALNLGDMLVKAGDPDAAVAIYRSATLVPAYASWPFRDVLDARIREARGNVDRFRRAPSAASEPTMMADSAFACMGCHQR